MTVFSTQYCTEFLSILKLFHLDSVNTTLHSHQDDQLPQDMKNESLIWQKVSAPMCSHVPLLKEKAFSWAVWRFVPSSTLSGGISLTLSMVCRSTGWRVSALAAIILWVCNTERAKNKARQRNGNKIYFGVLNRILIHHEGRNILGTTCPTPNYRQTKLARSWWT